MKIIMLETLEVLRNSLDNPKNVFSDLLS